MRLICANCDAQYEVAEDAIPPEGRDVQCSSCGYAWFQPSPHVLAAEAEEEELFEPPLETQRAPGAEPPEPEKPVGEEAPLGSSLRGLDESLLAVLREEAERETQARAREEAVPLETQGDLGLDGAAPSAISRAARRGAESAGIATGLREPPRAARGRDLLPDIEEINSTLRPGGVFVGARTMAPADGRSGPGFRRGFMLALLIGAVLVLAYLVALRLTVQVPQLVPVLDGYVAMVDGARLWLDGLIRHAVNAVLG
ncbi:MAG: zinc-ribbon domain-containing protein [Gemmobacter sp.]|jgi:predicted Zn finger-like uncharacterized protein|nr:zinc-ribbon domain-containing protein [Gemmobacter sp.]